MYFKPISIERARVQYFRATNEVRFAVGEIERDRAREIRRKAVLILQNAQRIGRNRTAEINRAKQRRRVDWNVAVF